ncbi:MAG: ABC transporter ATP-binding protein [Desulfobacterales bacterium]|jgi:spermidine/putrescine ABC transporter ATP-binding subunit
MVNTDLVGKDHSSEYSVILEDLTKKFGDFIAVDKVSLKIKRGEFITLLGPSGSGKTTILMMIAGFQMPTSGKVIIEGEMIVYKPSYKRNIGVTFQNYALFPHMTVFENIAFPLRRRKMEKKDIAEHVQKMLDLIELSDLGERHPRQLSGGQQQRVALARALVYNPPVLLLDEPLGALDKKLRENMQLEIKNLHETIGITMIYVTHDQAEALTMSDRIAVINNGRFEQIGTPTDLYERPSNKFVADFIGETNLIVGVKISGEEEGRFELTTSKGIKILTSKRSSLSQKEVSVAIRPERIVFVESLQNRLNTYEGIIEQVIYLGDTIKYRVLAEGRETLIITEKNDSKSKNYRRKDRIILGWNEEDMNLV